MLQQYDPNSCFSDGGLEGGIAKTRKLFPDFASANKQDQ